MACRTLLRNLQLSYNNPGNLFAIDRCAVPWFAEKTIATCGSKFTRNVSVALIENGKLKFRVELDKIGNNRRSAEIDDVMGHYFGPYKRTEAQLAAEERLKTGDGYFGGNSIAG